MKYFDTFPFVTTADNKGNYTQLVNLTLRSKLIPQLSGNPLLFYKYAIQEGDTPEIIAHKYYGDSYRYWIVLLANEILDPQWEWPMSGQVFQNYITTKYTDFNAYSTIHHYEKTLTQFDFGTNTTTTNTVEIDEDTYISLEETTKTFSLPTGDVSITVSKSAVNYYDYEEKLNESKRNINILNSNYVNQLETELQKLMSA